MADSKDGHDIWDHSVTQTTEDMEMLAENWDGGRNATGDLAIAALSPSYRFQMGMLRRVVVAAQQSRPLRKAGDPRTRLSSSTPRHMDWFYGVFTRFSRAGDEITETVIIEIARITVEEIEGSEQEDLIDALHQYDPDTGYRLNG